MVVTFVRMRRMLLAGVPRMSVIIVMNLGIVRVIVPNHSFVEDARRRDISRRIARQR